MKAPHSFEKICRDVKDLWNRSRELEKWRSRSHWQEFDSFHNSMTRYLKIMAEAFDLAGMPRPSRGIMIDWGSGGGASVLSLHGVFHTIYGVDVSRANLDECCRQAESIGYDGFVPVEISPSDPESVLDMIHSPVDYFCSIAVFFHLPSEDAGGRIMKAASALISPSGVGAVEVRSRRRTGRKSFVSKYSTYYRNFITYDEDEFRIMLKASGLEHTGETDQLRTSRLFFFRSRRDHA